MNTALTNNNPTNPSSPTTNELETPIPVYDRLVLWMFLLGAVLFGALLLADLFSGLLG